MRSVTQSAAVFVAIAAGLAVTGWPAAAAGGGPAVRRPLIGYVLAGGTSKLGRLDTATDRMLRPVTLSTAPDAMAIAPGDRAAYVLTGRSAGWAVNLATGRAVRVLGVGPGPYQVAFSADGATAYVLTRRALVAVDVATRRILARIPQAFELDGQILQVAPSGHALFLDNIATEVVTEVNTATNTVVGKLRIHFCYEAGVFSPDGRWLYLPTFSGLVAVNTVTGAARPPVSPGHCGVGPLLLAPGGKALYAPGSGARGATVVTRFDVAAGRLTPAWTTSVDPGGGGAAMAYDPAGSTLYVSTPLLRSVVPVSTATGAAGPSITDHLPGWNLVVGRSGRYLFATDDQTVAVINIAASLLVRTLHLGSRLNRFVFLVAGPGRRQVFAVANAGWLVPISAADGRAGLRIQTPGQPQTIIFGRSPSRP